MLKYTHVENLTTADVERLRSLYEPLTRAVRELIDATIRTEADAEAVTAATAQIDAAAARLRSSQLDGAFGIRFVTDGDPMPWGNAVIDDLPQLSEKAASGADPVHPPPGVAVAPPRPR